MLRFIDSGKMGRSQLGWLDSHFHFSFAEYYNPQNINFGVLRVINDDLVQPQTGFDMHPHRDMEILSYVVEGELSHADSMENRKTLTRGQVQYMSAGTGVVHSEHNWGKEVLRFLQIWIFPNREGRTPNYGDYPFKWEDRVNKWLPVATAVDNEKSTAPIKINADVNAYVTYLEPGQTLDCSVGAERQAYLVLIEGKADISGQKLNMRDALEIVEQQVTIKPEEPSHIFMIEMAKS
ncbi:pirin family protein [Deltaproteobacteria bacterium Smac51]|nr:pirin family protein [Deltaproteobacteria bacterium Smac51]